MKAAVHTRYGPPDVVRVVDVDKPVVTDHQVLVRVHATTVNRTDCGYRTPRPFFIRPLTGLTRPRLNILGNEFAGEVEETGAAVTAFSPGDRVFGYCEGAFGAHAEYLAVREDGQVATIPDGLTYEQAAPATEGSHYALNMIRAARIGSGQAVLVHGATGAIGSAAVQLVRDLGAEVTAVCGPGQLDLVKGLGAVRVFDHTAAEFTGPGQAGDQTYDVVIDAVGKSSFGRCRRLLKPGGVYLASDLGPWGQNPVLALITPLSRGRRVMFPVPREDSGMVLHFRGLMESGRFRPVIDRSYPLDRIVEAYRYVETGQKIGNVVIVP